MFSQTKDPLDNYFELQKQKKEVWEEHEIIKMHGAI
jgi:hypothetical protein